MAERLFILAAADRSLAGALPQLDAALSVAGFGIVTRQRLWLACGQIGEPSLESTGNPAMQLLTAAANKACISSILHQRMLELVQRIRRDAALKDQLGMDEPRERVPQLFFGQRCYVCNQAVGELPPNGRTNL